MLALVYNMKWGSIFMAVTSGKFLSGKWTVLQCGGGGGDSAPLMASIIESKNLAIVLHMPSSKSQWAYKFLLSSQMEMIPFIEKTQSLLLPRH